MAAKVELSVLREDLLHPYLAGNKWRKLKYNLEDFRNSGKKLILTFGGKFSNHLVACATAGKLRNIPMIAILRGEEKVSNPNLNFLLSCGMNLVTISREDYRLRNNELFLEKLYSRCLSEYPQLCADREDIFMIPEGGSNKAGVKGCSEIMGDIPNETTHICVACGTGSTLAGIGRNTLSHQMALGIAVLRGENFLFNTVINHGAIAERTKIYFDYHFGGYAKTTPELTRFCHEFSASTGIPLEPIYTGKLFFAVMDLISKNCFASGSKIVIFHSGGIFDFTKPLNLK